MARQPADITATDVPVRDTQDGFGADGYQPITEAKERQLISRMSRDELEDRYLRLREEHTELKKLTRKQEEKMKLMATKLLRLVKDRKRMDGNEKGSKRDVETAELIEDLEGRVRDLEKQNDGLKSKLSVMKQQLQTHGKKQTPYDRVKPRVNTGLPATKSPTTKQQRIREQMRVHGTPEPRATPRTPQPVLAQPRYGHSLLEETRIEKRELEDLVASLQEQIHLLEQDSETLREQLKLKQLEHEEELHQFRSQVTDTKRANVQENIELIRLQRELKEKAIRLQNLQEKYQSLEQVLTKVKQSHETVLGEMETLSSKLNEEQAKNSTLKAELRHGNISQQMFVEKEGQIDDLKEEISVLKEANSKLLHSAFDAEKERAFRAKEREYQIKIAQLEAEVQSDLNEKNDILDKLTAERDLHEKALKESKDLEISYYTSREELDDLKRKMNFFSKESKIDFNEIQEALLLIQARKEKKHSLDFLEQVDEEINKDLRKETQKLQAAHADTINELEKTRGMLVMQHKINQDYQTEVESLQKKINELKRETDLRLQEYAQLLDIRADRIKKLESQLRDVAYGTKQYKIQPPDDDDDMEELEASCHLERGQNVFEIHIGKMNLSAEGCAEFKQADPQTFVTYEFFEYELQSTPVMRGERPDFNFTSQYIVQVDDFFLHYLQKEQVRIELHRALGTDYSTIATGILKFDQILNRHHGRVHGTATFRGVQSQQDYGTIEYWVRLRVPMDQALRLYKERTKALGYITTQTLSSLDNDKERKPLQRNSEVNELRITVIRCYNLKSRRDDAQPCSYAVYKFFDFADHDTSIVQHSNAPHFDDARTYPVPMTTDLDNYLKTNTLQVYVFDDDDPESASYIGMAKIPLISLSRDKEISGTFELKQVTGEVRGFVDMSLKWLYTYLPATAKATNYASAREKTIEDPGGLKMRDVKETFRPIDDIESPSIAIKRMPDTGIAVRSTGDERSADSEYLNNKPRADIDKERELQSKDKSRSPSANEAPANVPVFKEEETSRTVDEKLDFVGSEIDTENESDQALLVEELRKTAEEPVILPENPPQDTLFEDQESDDDIVYSGSKRSPEERQIPDATSSKEILSEPESAVTSDSESVVVSPIGTKGSSSVKTQESVTVIVSSLTLFDNASILRMDNVKQLFVCYKFLDIDPEELETPFSLPKPPANRPIYFNFKKVFYFDQERYSERRQQLAFSLTEEGGGGKLYFTVVSEPGDGDDDECEDVAVAYVDFIQMLRNGEDLTDSDVDVVDLHGSDEVVGALTVTVEALEALRSLYA